MVDATLYLPLGNILQIWIYTNHIDENIPKLSIAIEIKIQFSFENLHLKLSEFWKNFNIINNK